MFTRLKLNSIQYGPGVLALIGILLLAAPLVLYLSYSLLLLIGLRFQILVRLISISVLGGIGLLGLFAVLLVVESVQDHALNQRYRKMRNRKVKISEEFYECQFCGNRRVREWEITCKICGNDLA